MEVDVLIVGGGPSGSSLGYQLQNKGISNCIIDKASFPRKKLCGGLLTEKTVDIIGEIYGRVKFPCERITSKVALFFGTRKLSSIQSASRFYLIDRFDFDSYFVEQYKAIGGTLIENAVLMSIDTENKIVALTDGTTIQYEFLVGADGANSEVRKQIDAKYRPNAICVEFDYPAENINDEIQVFFSAIRSGYGWCFPKKDRYTVGLGGTRGDSKDIVEAHAKFSASIEKPDTHRKRSGALIPYGKVVTFPVRGHILLIGDAAGFVDPITGEGIYFAFLSAKFAFEAIVEVLNTAASLESAYQSRITYIQKTIKEANFFNKVFMNDLMKMFCLKLIEGHTHITQFFCDNLLAHYNFTYFGFIKGYAKVRRLRKQKERNE